LTLTLKSATRDPYLLFWSLLLPIGGTVALGLLIQASEYPKQILTGMMAVSMMFYAFMTTSYTVLAHRRRGVYSLMRVTPMPLWKYIFSVSAAWTITAVLSGLLVLTAGTLVFQFEIDILSLLSVLPASMLACLGYVFLSFFVAGLSRTEGSISMITNVISLPLMFFSDAFYSLASAPDWIQTISRFNPFQWFVTALRSALDWQSQSYVISLLILAGICIAALVLAVRTFRYSDT
jgi:ABC-2 type transport system permease protein